MVGAARPDLVHKAICAGALGQIEWLPKAVELIRQHPRMRGKGFTPNGIKADVRAHVLANGIGCIQAQKETDAFWLEQHPDDPWWYKVVIEVDEFPQGLFVKLRLVDAEESQDPWVTIIGCHP
jgi:hypothetical protein